MIAWSEVSSGTSGTRADRMNLRTGAEYRDALCDGRRVFVMGGGRVDDVTTHPATAAMVEEDVRWYDRHREPESADPRPAPPGAAGNGVPVAFALRKTGNALVRMGGAFALTVFASAGNIPTPRLMAT